MISNATIAADGIQAKVGFCIAVSSSTRNGADDSRSDPTPFVSLRQWRRHGIVGFALRYTGDYLRNRLRGYGHWGAYRRIGFEIEADWVARRTLRAGVDHEVADDGGATQGSGRTDQVD